MEKDLIKNEEQINRREALAKSGKYAAFTALTMLTVLSPRKVVAGSGPTGGTLDRPSNPGAPPPRE
jgi:hypothetical protein